MILMPSTGILVIFSNFFFLEKRQHYKDLKEAIILKGEEFFIGTIKEIPAVVSQGESVDEARANVIDALKFYLEDMQQEKSVDNTVLEEDLIFG